MDPVDCRSMFIDDIVMAGADENRAVKDPGSFREVLTDLHAIDSGVDGIIGRAGFFCLGIPTSLGIKSIHVAGSPAKPDENAAVSLATR